ncbi:MAG TPA: transglutaminase family protein [Fimbriimonadaceae bacterium]|nr:transglutaminase family protein [Fimbriimonadaceae bacterium]
MRYRIEHTTRYDYADEVFVEPQTIRLSPRSDPAQRLVSHALVVEPGPAGMSRHLDAEGNSVCEIWFSGQTRRLEIALTSEVETLRANPYDYISPFDQPLGLPFRYRHEASALAFYRRGPIAPRVAAFAEAIAKSAGGTALEFLTALNHRLHDEWKVEPRWRGLPWGATRTLDTRRGACRDLSMLFVAASRALGLAARFVSGYHEGDPEQSESHLHAWAEVYIPGGGWRGFDPTGGLAVADRHVAVAAARLPRDAAPVSGSFRGFGPVRMVADVRIDRL